MKLSHIIDAQALTDPKPGQILSWDKQPKALRDRPGRNGRTVAQVVDVPDDVRRIADADTVRLRFIGRDDYFDFDRSSLIERLRAGTIRIESPVALLEALTTAFASEGRMDVASALESALRLV